MSTTKGVSFEQVTKVHGEGRAEVKALRDVSFVVSPGELVAVMGPSGSGKSTLLSLAGGLDKSTSGRVVVDGVALNDMSNRSLADVRRRMIGYVFQSFNLVSSLTAVENVSLPRELDRISVRAARAEALAALETVGLSDLAERFPEELSGGEQQRVAIARALVGERSILLADEPTGALDSVTAETVLRALRRSCDERRTTAILVTHNASHAAWADRILFLRDGCLIDQAVGGGPDSLLVAG